MTEEISLCGLLSPNEVIDIRVEDRVVSQLKSKMIPKDNKLKNGQDKLSIRKDM